MLLIGGLQTVAETLFEGRREEIRVRRAIIRSDAGLRERDLRKRADLGEAIRAGFTVVASTPRPRSCWPRPP